MSDFFHFMSAPERASLRLDEMSEEQLEALQSWGLRMFGLRQRPLQSFRSPVDDRAIEGLKFNACLPESLARKELAERLTDPDGIARTLTRSDRTTA